MEHNEAAADDEDEGTSVAGARAEASLPLAAVAKVVKEALPDGLRCASEVAPLVQSCLGEFLQMLASQANEKAAAEGKSTISEDHMRRALDDLGFGHYASAAAAAGAGARTASSRGDAPSSGGGKAGRKRKAKGKASELSEEELLKAQEALFASARQRVDDGGSSASGGGGGGGGGGGEATASTSGGGAGAGPT